VTDPYTCEVWGAFGHKQSILDSLTYKLFSKDNVPYEQIHIRACKQIIGLSKHASNFGCRAELGRLPLIYNIMVAICKYRARLEQFGPNNLLYHALQSQKNLHRNSNNCLTYDKFTSSLFNELELKLIGPHQNVMKEKCNQAYLSFNRNLGHVGSSQELNETPQYR
jgi:hypothetical protein